MGNYATVAQVRAEGVPASVTNTTIDSRITKWEKIIEKLLRNFFYEVEPGELIFDGNNSQLVHFNTPIISVTTLKINDETTALTTSDFRAFTGSNPIEDNRKNPKIQLTPIRESVYRTHPGIFVKGLDQRIDAKWGYVESDGSVPKPITEAVIQLVVLDSDGYFDAIHSPIAKTPLRRERTDGHEIEYTQVSNQQLIWDMMPNSIASILAMYRAPLMIDSPIKLQYYYDPGITIVGY